jgi:enoyl-[acyl-carrier protein] reductase II
MRQGDTAMGSLMAGQAAAMVCVVQPAAEIVVEMMSEAEVVMSRLGTLPKSE